MTWHAYYIDPIDWGWTHLKTINETLAEIAKGEELDHENYIKNDVSESEVNEFLEGWRKAKKAAKSVGWAGDFRNPPRVFWIPSEQYMEHGFVFKQENNGDTMVVSPKKLDWLENNNSNREML